MAPCILKLQTISGKWKYVNRFFIASKNEIKKHYEFDLFIMSEKEAMTLAKDLLIDEKIASSIKTVVVSTVHARPPYPEKAVVLYKELNNDKS